MSFNLKLKWTFFYRWRRALISLVSPISVICSVSKFWTFWTLQATQVELPPSLTFVLKSFTVTETVFVKKNATEATSLRYSTLKLLTNRNCSFCDLLQVKVLFAVSAVISIWCDICRLLSWLYLPPHFLGKSCWRDNNFQLPVR